MRRLAAAIFLISSLVVGAAAGATPLLRDTVVVDDDLIRLGDLFENAGNKADVAVAPAPKLGRRGIYDAAWLFTVARAHGLAWKPKTRFDRVVVERASQTLGAAEIEAALLRAVAKEAPRRNVRIDLDNRNLQLHVPPEVRPEIEVRDLWIERESDRFAARLAIASGDHPEVTAKVSGRMFEVMEIPVLRQPFAPGEVVTEADIEWTEIRADLVSRNTVTEAKHVLDMTPRRRTPAGSPLKSRDFRPPVVVEKGSIVTMILETPAMRLTAQGRAAEDGADGAVIKVVNTQSHQVVEGVVDGPYRVVIGAWTTRQ